MTKPTHTSTSGHAYLELQKLAKRSNRTTQELLERYVLERFLARLSKSRYRSKLILKGGMLLLILGDDRSTRDVDFLVRHLTNSEADVKMIVGEVANISFDDGVEFDLSSMTIAPIREGHTYQGMRITFPASINRAKTRIALDLNFGDPISQAAQPVKYPCLLSEETFPLSGYPLVDVLAEKILTMVERANVNTRDRDFGDVYALIRLHSVSRVDMHNALMVIADHRGVKLRKLSSALTTLKADRQQSWQSHRKTAHRTTQPERFADVVDAIAHFYDPLLEPSDMNLWDPVKQLWI